MIYWLATLLMSTGMTSLNSNSSDLIAGKGIFPPTGTPNKEGTSPTMIEDEGTDIETHPSEATDTLKDPSKDLKPPANGPAQTKKDYFPQPSS